MGEGGGEGVVEGDGSYGEALQRAERLLKAREEHLHGDSEVLARTKLLLGAILFRQQPELAVPLMKDTVAMRRRLHGANDERTADAVGLLAATLQATGKYDEALPLHEEALRIQREIHGDNHPNVAATLNNVATLYQATGEQRRALELQREAYDVYKRTNDPRYDTSALAALDNLVQLHQDVGDYDAALELEEEALRIQRSAADSEAGDLVGHLMRLVLLHETVGSEERALSLLEESVEIHRRVLAEGDAEVANALARLSLFHQHSGDFEKALVLSEEALEIRRSQFGDDHPLVAATVQKVETLRVARGVAAEGGDTSAMEEYEEEERIMRESSHTSVLSLISAVEAGGGSVSPAPSPQRSGKLKRRGANRVILDCDIPNRQRKASLKDTARKLARDIVEEKREALRVGAISVYELHSAVEVKLWQEGLPFEVLHISRGLLEGDVEGDHTDSESEITLAALWPSAAPQDQTVKDFCQWLEQRGSDLSEVQALLETITVGEDSSVIDLPRSELGTKLQEHLDAFHVYCRELEVEIWQKPCRQRKGRKREVQQGNQDPSETRAVDSLNVATSSPLRTRWDDLEDKYLVTYAVIIRGTKATERSVNAFKESVRTLFQDSEHLEIFDLRDGHCVSKGLLFAAWQLLEKMEANCNVSGQLLLYYCGEVTTHSEMRPLSEGSGSETTAGFNLMCGASRAQEQRVSLAAIHNLQVKSNLPTLLLVDGSYQGEAPRMSLCSPGTEDHHNAFSVFSHCPQSDFPLGCVAHELLTISTIPSEGSVVSPTLFELLSKAVTKSGESPLFLESSTVPFISESSMHYLCFSVPQR